MTTKKDVTKKDVQTMLFGYKTLVAEIIDIDLEIESLNNSYIGIKGICNNDIKPTSPTNLISSTVENEVEQKEKDIDRLRRKKKLKEIEVKRIENMLTTLRDDEKMIVELKFFECKRIKMIAYKCNLSEETVKKNIALILSSLTKFLNRKKK